MWIFDLGHQNNFEKSTSILKFSDKSMQNVGVGFLVIDTWAKWDFEIWPFLWFMEVKVVNLGPIDFQLGYPLISMKMMGKTHFKSISQKKTI